MEALIDTGSPYTVLSTVDALKFRLPIKKMQKGEGVKLAGFNFFNHKIGKAVFTFKTTDAGSVWFEIENLGVLIPTKINKKVLEDVEPIPSIIGNDFLEDHNLTLVFNPNQKITFLELP